MLFNASLNSKNKQRSSFCSVSFKGFSRINSCHQTKLWLKPKCYHSYKIMPRHRSKGLIWRHLTVVGIWCQICLLKHNLNSNFKLKSKISLSFWFSFSATFLKVKRSATLHPRWRPKQNTFFLLYLRWRWLMGRLVLNHIKKFLPPFQVSVKNLLKFRMLVMNCKPLPISKTKWAAY